VRVEGVVRPGDHVRRGGEDVGVGDVVIAAGTVLTPGQVGVAASLGLAALAVRRRPVIAILTTGDELVEPGLPLGPGQIYGSNGVALAGLVEQAGGTPRLLGNAPDDLDGMVARLEHATDADAVVTTGGVSVGDHDHVREALARLGAAIDFWKVRIKPGKPLAFGHVERGGRRVPIFGLPGNPVSCTVEFVQFVAPWVRTAMAARHPFGPVIDAVAEEAFRVRAGRVQFIRVALEHRDGRVYVRRTGEQGSGMLTSMARAHGLLVLPEHADGVAVGEPVRVQLLDTSFLHGDSPRYWREP
jgi:molybdopterin molybdotransferase